MLSGTLEAVDPYISLALTLDEFEQVLEVFPFIDQEEKQIATSAYKDTSQGSLDSFMQLLSEKLGIRKQGVLRLAGLCNLLRPEGSHTKPSRPYGIPSTLLGVLKATLIAGHGACGNPAIITAKLDKLSQHTIAIKGDESSVIPEEIVQSLLTQLASCIVENCSRILRSKTPSEFQNYEPTIDIIDQICRDFEREAEKARKATEQKQQADEQKRAADEEKIQKVQAWIEDVTGDVPDKHDEYASNRVVGTGTAFVFKVQEWLEEKGVPILLAHGPPGVGKTYLACAVISQHLEDPLREVDGLAYTYFSYNDRDRQTPFVVFAGIISQLVRTSTKLKEEMFQVFEEYRKVARKQQSQVLQSFRRAIINLPSTKLLVFDGLDEASEKTRVEILSLLKGARLESSRMLVTSRSGFRESLAPEQVLFHRVHADGNDIRAFSEDRMKDENVERIVRAYCKSSAEAKQLTSKISEEILTNSHGLFLHAYYAAKDVCGQVNMSGIKNAASKRHEDANKIYAATLERIDTLAAPQKALAYRTIAWLTFTMKPFEENELKEAFAISGVNGQVNPDAQIVVENIVEYCRGLVVRVKTRKVAYLRLAHMTVQEYFSQVNLFQQYHVDICLTCFNRMIFCLTPNDIVEEEEDSLDERSELGDAADEDKSDSSVDEALKEIESRGADEPVAHDWNSSDEGLSDSLSEDFDTVNVFEDHQSWRLNGSVWPQTLLPWIAKKTPFSLYAGRYVLSHLNESNVTPDLGKTVFKFIKTAISRKRRSTFTSKSQDHPYRMNMLHMASFIGLPSTAEAVLRMPMVHVDDRDILGRTALMWALGLGKDNFAEKLLDEGAQVQAYDRRGRSSLMYAATIRNEALLTNLIHKIPGTDISASLLFSCAQTNNVFLLNEALSRASINIDHVDGNGRTLLHEAVINCSEAVIYFLVQKSIRISAPDSGGRTPLMYAVQGQNGSIVKALVRAGAKSDTPSQDGECPLHIAAKNAEGGPRILRLLLRSGTKTLVTDRDGLVPLQTLLRVCQEQYRSEKDMFACVKLLSENPLAISHQSHDGANALHDAVKFPYLSILKYLISRAPPHAVNAQKRRGQTPIFEAVMAGNIPAFSLLIDLPGIDLLASRDDNKTLLNCAAWADEVAVAQKLINKDQRLIKLAEGHSVSAIHYAVERNNPAMFQLLLDAGSDPRSQRRSVVTPNTDLISYAAFEGRVWCLDQLLELKAWMVYDQSGQMVAHKDDVGKTLFHEAAASAAPAVLQKILKSSPLEGLSLEDRDAWGQTPLHYAARQRKEGLVSLLLKAGSDKDARAMNGKTPLDLALESEAIDAVRSLVLADAHVGQGSRPKSSKIQCYDKEDFFAKLNNILASPFSEPRRDTKTDLQLCEKFVHRVGTLDDVFDEWSPDIPFLEVLVPENAMLHVDQVIFETVSHDQGFSGESHQWGGTYEHSHTFFDAAVQNVWTPIANTGQQQSSRIRVQNNAHADFNFRTHINVFDRAGPDQERNEWVQSLRRGDRIQLYAKAMYPAWANYVQKAKITIRYQDMVVGEGIGEDPMQELPEKAQRLIKLEQDSRQGAPSHQPKVVIYHQSLHAESGIPISLRPLIQEKTGITAIIIGQFHLIMNHQVADMHSQNVKDNSSVDMHLNEYTINDPNLEDIWVDVEYLQAEGVKVIGMLSICGDGAMPEGESSWLGSCDNLTFERSYKVLHDLVVWRRLDGLNIDTEVHEDVMNAEGKERISLEGIIRLIDRLHTDFGPRFVIGMTASAESLLRTDTNARGTQLDHRTLEIQRGHLISWYSIRIFGMRQRSDDLANELRLPSKFKGHRIGDQIIKRRDPTSNFVEELSPYIRLLQHDVYRADKILISVSTTPTPRSDTRRERSAYVDPRLLHNLLDLLRWSYGPVNFGGVAGWGYFPAPGSTTGGDAGETRSPWVWVKETKAILESVCRGPE